MTPWLVGYAVVALVAATVLAVRSGLSGWPLAQAFVTAALGLPLLVAFWMLVGVHALAEAVLSRITR